jgi:hypothetical protein
MRAAAGDGFMSVQDPARTADPVLPLILERQYDRLLGPVGFDDEPLTVL